jgi:pyruvate formate lyase activating enzyme
VPLHFTAFHPDFKMTDKAATLPATVQRARRIALDEGLHYVYTGNIDDIEGGSTHCAGCGARLIERDWHNVSGYRISQAQRCPECRAHIAGRFARFGQAFGRKRIPITIS